MRAWLLKISRSLVMGVVITWLVAWECTVIRQETKDAASGIVDGGPAGMASAQCDRGWSCVQWTLISITADRAAGREQIGVPRWVRVPRDNQFVFNYGYGFPMIAMRHDVVYGTKQRTRELHGVIEPRLMGRTYRLPVHIVGWGFVVNTLVAAGVVLAIKEGLAALWRQARRLKGRCVSCGYDRTGAVGSGVCPECGWVVTRERCDRERVTGVC